MAIVGVAGRLPGGDGLDGFWRALVEGRCLLEPVPADRWEHADLAGVCPTGAFVDAVDLFDAPFFGVRGPEADVMDPQQRLLLEVLHEAAEDAAVGGGIRGSRTGLFVGQCFHDYDSLLLEAGLQDGVYDATGIAMAMSANRPSHALDLHGPSMTVDTACSSSLYALHLAVAALRRGECDMAFAAGANLILHPRHYRQLSALGALAPSGRCVPFDDRADGYVPGEAVAAVMLKPLSRALADGDPIHAVVRGTAMNHGGHASAVTAPNPERQTGVLRDAWADAGIDPATLGALEAHGTGTRLGDPIEVEAASRALADAGAPAGACVLGTAKATVGHAEGAAGIVGVVKALLSLRHELLPALPGNREPNPLCDVPGSRLRLEPRAVRWPAGGPHPRRIGVSSFGFGGANAHVVLEEAPRRLSPVAPDGPRLLPLSARSPEALRSLAEVHRDALRADGPSLAEVAATLQRGRAHQRARLVVVAGSRQAAAEALDGAAAGEVAGVDGPLSAIARAYVAGEDVDWPAAPSDRRASIPTYRFERRRHWLAAGPPAVRSAAAPAAATAGDQRRAVAVTADAVAGHLAASAHRGEEALAGLVELSELGAKYLAAVLGGDNTPARGAAVRERLTIPASKDRLAGAVALTLDNEAARGEPLRAAEADERLAALGARQPALVAHTAIMRAVIPELPGILEDRVDSLELYFSGQTAELLPAIYRGNAIADHFNGLVAAAVAAHVTTLRRRDPGREIRILEAGAGTGGTAISVLKVLDALPGGTDGLTYTFTDVSSSFLRAAKRSLPDFATRVEYAVLDLNGDVVGQGHEPGSQDIVLAANAVHATHRIDSAVAALRTLLADDGALLLNECIRDLGYLPLAFGGLPGWWDFEDRERRLDRAPMLSAATWREVLAEQGFDRVWTFGSPGVPDDEGDQALLLAAPAVGLREATTTPAARTSGVPAEPAASEPVRAGSAPLASAPGAVAPSDPSAVLRDALAERLAAFLDAAMIGVDDTFERHGLDSLGAVQLVRELEDDFGALPKVLLYECPTVRLLAEELERRNPQACARVVAGAAPTQPGPAPDPAATASQPAIPAPAASRGREPAAIVGLAATLPRSPDASALWRNLRDAVDLVGPAPGATGNRGGIGAAALGGDDRRRGAFLEDVERFDAEFFGISPLEAELMDPQQRLMLQAAWHAIEDAGHRPSELRGTRTGVYVGATSHDHIAHLAAVGREREAHAISGNSHSVISNRISFALDLRGPSETVDTACSSSLTALHRAVRALEAGDCEAAIVGGVHLMLRPQLFAAFEDMGMVSPTGRCAAFDHRADGFVRGEGVVAVLLKPLSRALADNDTIQAVVRGSGVGHGGRVQSLPVPNPAAQGDLIAEVLRTAAVDPRTLTYVEAHGTGTSVGDPIEVRGLERAFAALGVTGGGAPWCALGSIKSNAGHLEAAAGLAGLAKTVLALRHRTLPASLHFERANPLLELDRTPFEVVARTRPWEKVEHDGAVQPRRAGVSSFGFGGANAHVLLEEHQEDSAADDGDPRLFVLSGPTAEALTATARRLAEHLAADDRLSLTTAEVAYTLLAGREAHEHRAAVAAASLDELADALRELREGEVRAEGTLADGARRWVAGGEIGAGELGLGPARRRRVSLPGHPFAETRFWAVAPASPAPVPAAPTGAGHAAPDDGWEQILAELASGERTIDEVEAVFDAGGAR